MFRKFRRINKLSKVRLSCQARHLDADSGSDNDLEQREALSKDGEDGGHEDVEEEEEEEDAPVAAEPQDVIGRSVKRLSSKLLKVLMYAPFD